MTTASHRNEVRSNAALSIVREPAITSAMQAPADAIESLEEFVKLAESAGASDIHFAHGPERVRVEFRLDGELTPVKDLSLAEGERLCGRIKYLARLKTYQESLPQDGRISRADVNASCDLRVSTYPTIHGEKVVLRLFNQSVARPLDQLGLPAAGVAALRAALGANAGLILLTGPAGSGKTTTIYSALRHLTERGGRHVITVEDPVEQTLAGVMQTEINEARGLTFAVAARHLLRQDPQTLVIGEIRDDETARIAVQGALTGHQVIATLHAGSCRGVFDRLMSLSADAYAATATVRLILNQRLVRTFGEKCNGAGCPVCFTTGYRGRRPIAEWFAIDDVLRERLRREGAQVIQPAPTLAEAAAELVTDGRTSRAEVERMIGT
jgi:type II secretory ATPase GspE/PulE/Tfp pilus assembly ATPase PilB-like protein